MLKLDVAFLLVLLAAAATQASPRGHFAQDRAGNLPNDESRNPPKHFDYGNPDEWSKEYPTCGGKRQSPINIDFQDVEAMDKVTQLVSSGYDNRPLEMSIVNTGNSVQLKGVWAPQETPSIQGGPLSQAYHVAQVHFHWGAKDDVGSEHTIVNRSFPMEMHVVHWNTKYENFTEAVKHGDGLAVLGYLMSLKKNTNMGIDMMGSWFHGIRRPEQSVNIDPFPLSVFDLNLSKHGYFTYLGSLTTPPCSESVIWLLSAQIKAVTLDELKLFRRLHLYNRDRNNYRHTRPLNGRSISYVPGVSE